MILLSCCDTRVNCSANLMAFCKRSAVIEGQNSAMSNMMKV